MHTQKAVPGVEITDLLADPGFAKRVSHNRNRFQPEEGLRRLARVFTERPERILQELANVAREFCAADSSGISVEEVRKSERNFRWVATSGRYAAFQDATLPYDFAPCGVCLDRGKPQLFRVGKPFFEVIGVDADPVTDGMLIPWQVESMRGTVWVVSHVDKEAFDLHDYDFVEALADFAAIAVRYQRQQTLLSGRAAAEARAAIVNELSHQINNPLQAITNMLFIASQGEGEAKTLAAELAGEFRRLSKVVAKLLVSTNVAIGRKSKTH